MRNIDVMHRVARYQTIACILMSRIVREDKETDYEVNNKDKRDCPVRFYGKFPSRPRHFVRSHLTSYYLLFLNTSNGDTPGLLSRKTFT